jgi:hypothetical protein
MEGVEDDILRIVFMDAGVAHQISGWVFPHGTLTAAAIMFEKMPE